MTSPPAQAQALSCDAAWAKYAREAEGWLGVEGMRALLRDLGLLEGRSAADATDFVVRQFALASRTKGDKLSRAEFDKYYAKVTAPRLLDALTREAPAEVAALLKVFLAYASFGAARGAEPAHELDGARFIKLAKESGLVGRRLATTDCDLMFAKAKDRNARRITFEQFLDVLDLVAAKKQQPLAEVVRQVAGAAGPGLHGVTEAEAVRFHDDVSTYTGMHAARRSSVGTEGTAPGSTRRRSSVGAAAAGTPASSAGCLSARSARSGASSARGASQLSARRLSEAATPDVQSRDALLEAFTAFAAFGKGASPAPSKAGPEMDSKAFVKCMRDAGVIDRKLTAASCDLAFVAKAKPLGARKIGFRQFREAVAQLAAEKGVAKEELFARIASCGGPSLNSTVTPEAVCAESGRLLARAAAASPTLAAAGDAVAAAAWSAAAAEAEAAHSEGSGEVEAEAEEAGGAATPASEPAAGIAAGVGKLNLGGPNVVNISVSAVAASPREA